MTDEKPQVPEGQAEPAQTEDRTVSRLLDMDKRLRTLNLQLRLLGAGLAVALVALITVVLRPGLLGGPGSAAVLSVRHLVLLDEAGRPRGEWRVDEEGNSRLTLQDRLGQARLSLAVLSAGSPGLSLIDATGHRRAALGLLPDETTSLVFADAAGIPRAVLGLNPSNATHLVFADAQGVGQVALGVDGSGVGTIMLPETGGGALDTGRTEGGSW
jgi:hypothetical protein